MKRWLKRMKTLVAAVGRYVALFSREPQINTPPPTPCNAIRVVSRALTISSPPLLPFHPSSSTDGTRSNRWKDRIAARAAGHFSTKRTSLLIKSSMKEFYGAESLSLSLEWDIRSVGKWFLIFSFSKYILHLRKSLWSFTRRDKWGCGCNYKIKLWFIQYFLLREGKINYMRSLTVSEITYKLEEGKDKLFKAF